MTLSPSAKRCWFSEVVKLDISIDTRAVIRCVWKIRKLCMMVLSVFWRLKMFVAFEAIVIHNNDVHSVVAVRLLLECRGTAKRCR